MNRILTIIGIVSIMCISLVGCSGQSSSNSSDGTTYSNNDETVLHTTLEESSALYNTWYANGETIAFCDDGTVYISNDNTSLYCDSGTFTVDNDTIHITYDDDGSQVSYYFDLVSKDELILTYINDTTQSATFYSDKSMVTMGSSQTTTN